jgi:hypothetical protein
LTAGPTAGGTSARTPATDLIDRQVNLATVGKLQVARADTELALAAAALNDVSRADREPARKTIC